MADDVAPLTVTKPQLSAGAFQFSTTALDNDLGTAPAGFWSVQPVDLLANDNAAASILNPASVLLYSAASGGSGARTLSTAQGLYSVDARGVLTLQPTADFSGSDSLWYTVADATGKVSARTLVTVSATATSAARDDAATTLKIAADSVVAVSHRRQRCHRFRGRRHRRLHRHRLRGQPHQRHHAGGRQRRGGPGHRPRHRGLRRHGLGGIQDLGSPGAHRRRHAELRAHQLAGAHPRHR